MKETGPKEYRLGETVISVKVWEKPVVICHWVTALSIVVLGITGYFIADPPFSQPGEASSAFTMGDVRFIHITAGFVLLASFLVRLYWGFAGNRFSNWFRMLPLRKSRWLAMGREVEDLLKPHRALHRFSGHTPLANLSYVFLYLLITFSLLSGFTLHAQSHYTPLWRWLGAAGLAFFGGNLNTVHLLHHLCLWLFAGFVMIHLYLVAFTVLVCRSTEIDAIISGKKLLLKESLSPYDEP